MKIYDFGYITLIVDNSARVQGVGNGFKATGCDEDSGEKA
jgi:hypothetical protein